MPLLAYVWCKSALRVIMAIKELLPLNLNHLVLKKEGSTNSWWGPFPSVSGACLRRKPKTVAVAYFYSFRTTYLKSQWPEPYLRLLLQPVLNLRDLGLSDLKASQLDELVDKLLPGYCVENKASSPWHTSYISAQSFFENKHGMF